MIPKQDTKLEQWTVLTDEEQVGEIVKLSHEKPQLIYKHSQRCGTCRVVKDDIDESFDVINEKAGMNFIDVVDARGASDAVEEQLGIRHESPQALIVEDGECCWDKSHYAINSEAILEVLES